jgi:hypothetical protein
LKVEKKKVKKNINKHKKHKKAVVNKDEADQVATGAK